MSTTHSSNKPSFPAFPQFPQSPFTPPFDELFSLYHAIPLQNNPHIRLPPCSIPRNQLRLPIFFPIDPPLFGSFPGPQISKFDGRDPPGCIYNIDDYFDFYATPHHHRIRLLRLCEEGLCSRWLRWMQTNVLLQPIKIPVAALSSAPPPPWIELPGDVTANILHRLGAEGMLTSAQVCATWRKVSKDPDLWRVIDFSNPSQGVFNGEYNVICRRAVDRSQGLLVDLTVQYFGDDALLDYIVHRSPNLKRLKLGTCFFISGYCARRMVAKLPQLEELHLTLRPGIGACDIEVIGKSCPMLKSFSLNGFKCILPDPTYGGGLIHGYFQNLYARAISRSMHNLQHLQVFAHWIGNEGLEAILNGCPRLESLDIRRCFDLDLQGDLGKRCRQQIKHLKLPSDSISDIPWPNCDGGDPFTSSAFWFEYYIYKLYTDNFPRPDYNFNRRYRCLYFLNQG